jgi:AbrB family looped-hinge helix DNA binding protein
VIDRQAKANEDQLAEIKAAGQQTDRMIEHAGKQADAACLNAHAVVNAERQWMLILIVPYTSRMETFYTHINSKGYVIIPAQLREQLKLSSRTRVSIQREGNTLVLRPIIPEFIGSLIGCTKAAGAERERLHRDDQPGQCRHSR